jgi:predicted nucleotidyltransferase
MPSSRCHPADAEVAVHGALAEQGLRVLSDIDVAVFRAARRRPYREITG